MLTAVPVKFDPDFIDRLSKRYGLTTVVLERRAQLEAHCRGHFGGELTYPMRSLIKRALWTELIAETYEQRAANGEQIDVGALTQLGNALKGYYKDLGGVEPPPKVTPSVRGYLAARSASTSTEAA
jgi:hypothetical protein